MAELREDRCQTCGAPITWVLSKNGKRMPLDLPAEKRGERIIMKGTIKKLETYQGEKQTILTRCKLYHEDGKEKTWQELGL